MNSQWTNRSGLKCLARRHLSSSFSRGRRESFSFPSHLFQTNLSPTPLLPPHLLFLPAPSTPPPPILLFLLSPIPFFVITLGEFPADSVCHGNQPVLVTGPAAHTSCVCRQRLAAWACQPGLESNTLQWCLFSFFLTFFFLFHVPVFFCLPCIRLFD